MTTHNRRSIDHALPDEHDLHHEYIKQVLEREARRAAFQRAIIEKTFVALLWSVITGVGVVLMNMFKEHWK